MANGRYEVGQEINRGGTAVVYEGYDSTLRMKVALKVRRRVTHPSFPPSRAQLCEEKKSDPPHTRPTGDERHARGHHRGPAGERQARDQLRAEDRKVQQAEGGRQRGAPSQRGAGRGGRAHTRLGTGPRPRRAGLPERPRRARGRGRGAAPLPPAPRRHRVRPRQRVLPQGHQTRELHDRDGDGRVENNRLWPEQTPGLGANARHRHAGLHGPGDAHGGIQPGRVQDGVRSRGCGRVGHGGHAVPHAHGAVPL